MPVRSSICAYSPSATSSASRYSSPSSLSVGHYKPLSSISDSTPGGSPLSSGSHSSTTSRPFSRYSSSYSPVTYSTLPSSSPYSTGGKSTASQISSNCRPLSTSFSASRTPTAAGAHSRYSTSSSSGVSSSSSSSLSSAGSSLLADPLTSSSSSGYLSSATIGSYLTYHPSPSSPSPSTAAAAAAASRRRFSRTSFDGTDSSPILSTHNYQTSSYRSSPSSHRTASSSSSSSYATSNQLPAEVPRGLVNLGNTCYMNSAIQSLYSIESFRQLILRSGGGGGGGGSYDKPLLSELCNLFKSMQRSDDGHSGPLSPRSFHNVFSRRHQSKFTEYHQQDAQEFLRYLINSVHEECNRASKRPRGQRSPPSAPKSADEAWSQYREIVDDSPFVDLLVGQMCSTIVCSNCQNKSLCWDPFWDLSLPLQRGRHYGPTRLSDVIDDFCAKETLDADERPICGQCKKATRSTKQIKLSRLPRLLILHLKKFSNDGYKLTNPQVQIDKTLLFNENTSYCLQACISHHGHSSSSGHYTSHCKYSTNWYHFNDDRVRDVGSSFESGVNLEDAYVLFYTQQQSPTQPRAMMTTNNSSGGHTNHQSKL